MSRRKMNTTICLSNNSDRRNSSNRLISRGASTSKKTMTDSLLTLIIRKIKPVRLLCSLEGSPRKSRDTAIMRWLLLKWSIRICILKPRRLHIWLRGRLNSSEKSLAIFRWEGLTAHGRSKTGTSVDCQRVYSTSSDWKISRSHSLFSASHCLLLCKVVIW